MSDFSNYMEELAREHKLVGHSEEECHFSDMASDLAQKLRRKMCYPCVAVDCEGFSVAGTSGNMMLREVYDIYVLAHVRDTGDQAEVRETLAHSREILKDILRRMVRDKARGNLPWPFSRRRIRKGSLSFSGKWHCTAGVFPSLYRRC